MSLSNGKIEKIKAEIAKVKNNGESLYYYGNVFLLILNTGPRMGEALSLQWEDVDMDNKVITVNKNQIMTKKRDAGGKTLSGYELKTQKSTKTTSGNRVIPINQSAERALLKLKADNATPHIIINSRQKLVLPGDLECSFHVVLRNAGMDDNHGIHVLRHTFASMLPKGGIRFYV